MTDAIANGQTIDNTPTLAQIRDRDAEWEWDFVGDFDALHIRPRLELVSPREWAVVDRSALLKMHDALRAKLEEAQILIRTQESAMECGIRQRAAAERERDALKQRLERLACYAMHTILCETRLHDPLAGDPHETCTCGLEAALKEPTP